MSPERLLQVHQHGTGENTIPALNGAGALLCSITFFASHHYCWDFPSGIPLWDHWECLEQGSPLVEESQVREHWNKQDVPKATGQDRLCPRVPREHRGHCKALPASLGTLPWAGQAPSNQDFALFKDDPGHRRQVRLTAVHGKVLQQVLLETTSKACPIPPKSCFHGFCFLIQFYSIPVSSLSRTPVESPSL